MLVRDVLFNTHNFQFVDTIAFRYVGRVPLLYTIQPKIWGWGQVVDKDLLWLRVWPSNAVKFTDDRDFYDIPGARYWEREPWSSWINMNTVIYRMKEKRMRVSRRLTARFRIECSPTNQGYTEKATRVIANRRGKFELEAFNSWSGEKPLNWNKLMSSKSAVSFLLISENLANAFPTEIGNPILFKIRKTKGTETETDLGQVERQASVSSWDRHGTDKQEGRNANTQNASWTGQQGEPFL